MAQNKKYLFVKAEAIVKRNFYVIRAIAPADSSKTKMIELVYHYLLIRMAIDNFAPNEITVSNVKLINGIFRMFRASVLIELFGDIKKITNRNIGIFLDLGNNINVNPN